MGWFVENWATPLRLPKSPLTKYSWLISLRSFISINDVISMKNFWKFKCKSHFNEKKTVFSKVMLLKQSLWIFLKLFIYLFIWPNFPIKTAFGSDYGNLTPIRFKIFFFYVDFLQIFIWRLEKKLLAFVRIKRPSKLQVNFLKIQ